MHGHWRPRFLVGGGGLAGETPALPCSPSVRLLWDYFIVLTNAMPAPVDGLA